MFRTAVRQFSRTAYRAAGSVPNLSIAEIEAANKWTIDISKTQSVAQNGFIDGMQFGYLFVVLLLS
jgi:hypothetical protein